MASARVVVESDIPAVVALFERVHPAHRWESRTACESYFREILFENPWRDPDLPSWVVEDQDSIVAFAGVVPRRMSFRGRPIRVAVGCQFMVDAQQRHSLAMLQLAKAALSGPQDLFIADGANDAARRACLGIGGSAPLLYSFHWTRPLRPLRYALSVLERTGRYRGMALAGRPLAAPADAMAARLHKNRLNRQNGGLREDALDAATMLTCFALVLDGAALRPVYDATALPWLLHQAGRKTRHGTLRARVVLDERGEPIGWYLYYVKAGAVSEVVQIAARPGAFAAVLQRLLGDAWRHGAIALRGRLDPRHVQELSDRHCWFRREGEWMLVHSRRPEVAAAIAQGDAFLSRLEGEWWQRFLGG